MAVKFNKIFAIRIIIGCLFLFSGIVKLFPVVAFEVQLISHGISSRLAVAILARAIIAFELFLGVSFFQSAQIKKFFIPAAVILLIIFSADLIRTIVMLGFSGNCGCFGEVIVMTPLEALVKNAVLIMILLYLYGLIKEERSRNFIFFAVYFTAIYLLVFILFPAQKFQIEQVNTNTTGPRLVSMSEPANGRPDNQGKIKARTVSKTEHVSAGAIEDPSSVILKINNFKRGGTVNLGEGKKLVVLLSLGCGNCVETAEKIGRFSKEIKMPPVYFLFLGKETFVPEFFREAGVSYPYKILDDETFFSLIKNHPPRIIIFINGSVAGDWNDKTFTERSIRRALDGD